MSCESPVGLPGTFAMFSENSCEAGGEYSGSEYLAPTLAFYSAPRGTAGVGHAVVDVGWGCEDVIRSDSIQISRSTL